jgi:quinohemoprotein ethanol dehydrogenase
LSQLLPRLYRDRRQLSLKTGGDGSNWAMTGLIMMSKQHSPRRLINDGNVQDLGIAWFADLPDGAARERRRLL